MNFIPHLNGNDWAQVIKQKWWINQQNAVEVMANYLASKSDRQAMVRMPTGTGKTVVIATLAQLSQDYPCCLVVAPWENLVKQIQRELRDRLWKKVGEDKGIDPKPCEVFTPSSLGAIIKKTGNKAGVLLCTNQTLQMLRTDEKQFKALQKWCQLTLVDEGHREPAPKWAAAVRDLNCPTILFTATPYRNDLQLFDLDPDYLYSFTFGEALSEQIVRNVKFIDGSWALTGTDVVTQFTDQIVQSCESVAKMSGKLKEEIRVIVRCKEADEIKRVVTALLNQGKTAIGIHERFKAADGKPYRKDVPDPASEKAQFWVHQNKLLEGLDDPAFRLIAIFGPFTNARNLVQQVGRVIRNPKRESKQKAYVLAHIDHNQGKLWERFLEYEDDVRKRIAEGKNELSAFEDFIAVQSNAPRFYFLGDFRKHLHPDDAKDPRSIIRMRKSILVRTPKSTFQWKPLVTGIQHELLSGDTFPYGEAYNTAATFLQLFRIYEQSDIVTEAYLESRLGYVFAKQIGNLVFFYDSEGRSPDYLRNHTDAIPVESLQRLLPDQNSVIREISLINGDFGNHTYRRRVLSTQSLEIVPPSLSDYVQVCSTTTGTVKELRNGKMETHRRYLSFTRGRLSERTSPVLDYPDFEPWLSDLAARLNNAAFVGDDTLRRFASSYTYKGTEVPKHILFDVTSEGIDATNMTALAVNPSLDNLWLINQGKFFGEIDECYFEAAIQKNLQTERFEIESDQLDEVLITREGVQKSLTKYLNETQNFRILLDSSTVYTQGRFFTPNLLPWRGGGNRINIEKIVIGCPSLVGITSEKGDKSGWLSSSVFGVISDKNHIFSTVGWEPEILVCNDVGVPEIADFFALCERTKKIIMIHAKKASDGSKLSASAFHDVCSQAVRYLGFFNPNDRGAKLTKEKLDVDWCPDQSIYRKMKRIVWAPSGCGSATIVKKINSALSDPSFAREVWIVMGNGLSQAKFVEAVNKTTPKPNEREMSYLFQSTWCAVASVGATLKVICMP